MKNIKLIFALIAVVMLVELTNCKKEVDDKTSVTKYVGTVNGSFVAKDASIKITKDLDPSQLATRNWIMYAKNSPFYGNQPLALVTGKEFITGSAAQQWWSVPANNPVSFAASQAVYSNLTPAEPVRLVMEGKDGSGNVAYLGVLDFDPTAAQFPLAVTSKSLGDKLIVNADGLTSKPGGNLISVSVLLQVTPVDIQATEKTLQLSSFNEGSATGVTGALDFQNIVYNNGMSSLTSQLPVGAGDCEVFNSTASKIKGITIIITFAPSPSAPGVSGSTITLTPQAAGPGQFLKIILTTSKLGWYDSATIGVNDQDITVNEQTISVDGQDNNNPQSAPVVNFTVDRTNINAGETVQFTDQSTNSPTSWLWNFGDGQTSTEKNPSHAYTSTGTYSVTLTATNNSGSNLKVQSNYITVNSGGGNQQNPPPPIVSGISLNPSVNYMIDPSSSIFLGVDGMGHATVSTQSISNYGDITDMGALDLVSILQSTPNYLGDPPAFNSFASSVSLIQGHSYVVRYKETQSSPYIYGLFYITGYQNGNFTITYQGPFINNN